MMAVLHLSSRLFDRIERPTLSRNAYPIRRWDTSSTDDSADSLPMELFALGEHRDQCLALRGRLFVLLCHAERLHGFLQTHLVSTVVLVVLLIVLCALVQ